MPRGVTPTGKPRGRPKGSASKRTREIADRAFDEGIMPLEVMLKAMRIHAAAERWDDASRVAKDAAPYVHARLQAVEHTGADGGPIKFVGKLQRDAAVSAALRADT